MPSHSRKKTKVVTLNEQWEHSWVTVLGTDGDNFSLPIEEAIDACRASRSTQKTLQCQQQILRLADKLAEWIDGNKHRVSRGYLTIRDRGLLFVVISRQASYNLALENDLTQLDLDIANDKAFDLVNLDVMALPDVPEEDAFCFLSNQYTARHDAR